MSDLRWTLALRAAALIAVDPIGLGGATIRTAAGPVRDAWLDALRDLLPEAPMRRLPPGTTSGRLVGGLDLAATLAASRPVAERGLLSSADGGVLIVPMAERLGADAIGPMVGALDMGAVLVERDGLTLRMPARFAAILLDEGLDDEHAPDALTERLAFRLDLGGVATRTVRSTAPPDSPAVHAAREALPLVTIDEEAIAALCTAGMAFGVPSLRLASLALRVAKASAALEGRTRVEAEDVELAAALVIAPRATRLPETEAEDTADEPAPEQKPEPEMQSDTSPAPNETDGEIESMADRVVEATRAAIPAGLLASLGLPAGPAGQPSGAGRAGMVRQSAKRGRPVGTRRGLPGPNGRLAIVDTLRAAAPWQPLRLKAAGVEAGRILVRREDFRLARFKDKSETTTIFVVDASGSAALHRLAEVKGAVELILAECYVRRDSVALIAFRGTGAEVLLPPTRSLARAKRALAGQAGGGGTPLACGLEAAVSLVDGVRRRGQSPAIVVLTDGKANIDREGRAGRPRAEADATAAARALRAAGCPALLLDIAPRPSESAAQLAASMGALYLPLPYADARAVSQAVLGTTARQARATQR